MTRKTPETSLGVGLVVLASALAGCAQSDPPAPAARADWALTLKVDGAEVTLPLEAMNVYLADNHAYPEHFEVLGAGITLVGEFPLETRVDYEERWDVLIGKPIALSPHGGHPGRPRESSVTLPGRTPMAVVGGSFVARKVSGSRPGKEGDKTLSGDLTIHAQDGNGQVRILSGTFAVHCLTWG